MKFKLLHLTNKKLIIQKLIETEIIKINDIIDELKKLCDLFTDDKDKALIIAKATEKNSIPINGIDNLIKICNTFNDDYYKNLIIKHAITEKKSIEINGVDDLIKICDIFKHDVSKKMIIKTAREKGLITAEQEEFIIKTIIITPIPICVSETAQSMMMETETRRMVSL